MCLVVELECVLYFAREVVILSQCVVVVQLGDQSSVIFVEFYVAVGFEGFLVFRIIDVDRVYVVL